MWTINKRILKGHEVVGYMVTDDLTGKTANLSTQAVKDGAKAGLVFNVKLAGDALTGVNGFQLRDLPGIQLDEARKQVDKSTETPDGGITLVNKIVFGFDTNSNDKSQLNIGYEPKSKLDIGYELKNNLGKPITIGSKTVNPGETFLLSCNELAILYRLKVKLEDFEIKVGSFNLENSRCVAVSESEHKLQAAYKDSNNHLKLKPEYEELADSIPYGMYGLYPVSLYVIGNTDKIAHVCTAKENLNTAAHVLGCIFKNNTNKAITIKGKNVAPDGEISLGRSEFLAIKAKSFPKDGFCIQRTLTDHQPYLDLKSKTGSSLTNLNIIQCGYKDDFGEWTLNTDYSTLESEFTQTLKWLDDRKTIAETEAKGENKLYLARYVYLKDGDKAVKIGYILINKATSPISTSKVIFEPDQETFVTESDFLKLANDTSFVSHLANVRIACGQFCDRKPFKINESVLINSIDGYETSGIKSNHGRIFDTLDPDSIIKLDSMQSGGVKGMFNAFKRKK